MRDIKFRGIGLHSGKMIYGHYMSAVAAFDGSYMDSPVKVKQGQVLRRIVDSNGTFEEINPETLGQYTGMKDCEGKEYFIGDIGEFENGDRFVLKMEDWLEVYVDWIGEPECEDQARDLYRIKRGKIIGNIHENQELLK